MDINDDIFLSYLNCKYKAFLKYNGGNAPSSKFDLYYKSKLTELKLLYQNKIAKQKFNDLQNSLIDTNNFLNSDWDFTLNAKININNKNTSVDAIEKLHIHDNVNKLNIFKVIVISPRHSITKEDKLLLTYKNSLLENIFGKVLTEGKLLYRYDLKSQNIKITAPLKNEVKRIISEIEGFADKINVPALMLNKHCQLCEFENLCHQEATKKDDLSLLKTLKEKEIKDFNKKGIFTVTQLSYTFRPRRQLKKVKRRVKKHHASIKALAIREKKVFIYEQPNIPTTSTKIYLDIEGIPNKEFFYLIGMIIEHIGKVEKYSLWINDESEIEQKLLEFINKIRAYKNITIYHYGSYETKFLKFLSNSFPENGTVKRMFKNSVNIVSYVYPSIYFPTYSNGLKDIAKYLGFKWTDENMTGIESVFLRYQWESNNDISIREKLITYNIDDCYALKKLTEFLQLVSSYSGSLTEQFPSVDVTENFDDQISQRYGGHKFDNPNFAIDNFDYINKCSYYEYQRSKIYLKTDEILKKTKSNTEERKKFNKKPNIEVNISRTLICPNCKSKSIRLAARVESKTVVDIKFFNGGVKKWITKYNSNRHQCRDCLKTYFPNKYKNIGIKYGHNLISWVVYQNIVNGISFEKIEKTLADTFQISIGSVGGGSIYRFKTLGALYYEKEYNRLISNIKNWKIIHVDETKVRVQGLPGYIWVFTNMTDVAFIYTETRKSDFIKKVIKEFKGVLISDFYKGYEGLDCKQQKCLVHLIRDINDTLFKHQLNFELKQIAQNFSVLLKNIVDTTKKHGLKKRYLLTHQKDVNQFYDFLEQSSFKSDEAKKIYNRFIRFKNNLFLFLEHDGVPWNNNNAEHAFKHFATYRRGVNGIFTQDGINKYLILLSVYETCKYRNINFFKFLLSREKYLDIYTKKYTNLGNLKKNCTPHRNSY